MSLSFGILPVLALSVVELWAAIPAAFALGFPTPLIILVVSIGAIIGVIAASFLGSTIHKRIAARKQKNAEGGEKKPSKLMRVWQKFGVVGFGFVAPLAVGSFVGSAIGMSLGANRTKLIVCMGIGVIVWTAVLALAAHFGVSSVAALA